jgi:inositol phosphorylceramide synthase catalytic subunit
MKWQWWPLLLGFAYIGVIAMLGGMRWDHVGIGLLGLLHIYSHKTRLFLRVVFPLILTGVIFDSLRYYYWEGVTGHIHVVEPYLLDIRWFGIPVMENGAKHYITLNEYFLTHTSPILDMFCGIAYIFFVIEYLVVAFYLFFVNELTFLRRFVWGFFTVNLMGYVTYFIYPAAPPWYVTQYGFGPAHLRIPFSPGAGTRFDEMFGVHIFEHMYARGIDVFGAYPSLHVAYPLLVVWATFMVDSLRRWRVFAIAFYALMVLSAVYLQQHYIEDVLLGTAYTLFTIACFTPKTWMLFAPKQEKISA